MVVDLAAIDAEQVEIGMIGQIHRRRFIGVREVVDLEFVLVGQSVLDLAGQVAGVPFLAVGATVVELHGRVVGGFRFFALPHDLVEPLLAAVQVMSAIVRRQGVFLAVEGELGVGDAVGHAAGDAAEVGVFLQIRVQVVKAEDHVVELASLVGDVQFGDDPAQFHDLRGHARRIGQGEYLHRGAVRHLPEFLHFDTSLSFLRVVGNGRGAQQRGGGHGKGQFRHGRVSLMLQVRCFSY